MPAPAKYFIVLEDVHYKESVKLPGQNNNRAGYNVEEALYIRSACYFFFGGGVIGKFACKVIYQSAHSPL